MYVNFAAKKTKTLQKLGSSNLSLKLSKYSLIFSYQVYSTEEPITTFMSKKFLFKIIIK
jgi:hypothetical protein